MAVLYDAPAAGHGHEPPELSRPLISLAYSFFDHPVEPTRRERKLRRPAATTADENAGT
jgi:hypothetical protein